MGQLGSLRANSGSDTGRASLGKRDGTARLRLQLKIGMSAGGSEWWDEEREDPSRGEGDAHVVRRHTAFWLKPRAPPLRGRAEGQGFG